MCPMSKAEGKDAARKSAETPENPTCPVCGYPAIPLVYGLPDLDTIDAGEEGRLVLGGCVVSEANWACSGPEQHVW